MNHSTVEDNLPSNVVNNTEFQNTPNDDKFFDAFILLVFSAMLVGTMIFFYKRCPKNRDLFNMICAFGTISALCFFGGILILVL